jgi:hypothetical protein
MISFDEDFTQSHGMNELQADLAALLAMWCIAKYSWLQVSHAIRRHSPQGLDLWLGAVLWESLNVDKFGNVAPSLCLFTITAIM